MSADKKSPETNEIDTQEPAAVANDSIAFQPKVLRMTLRTSLSAGTWKIVKPKNG